MNDMWIEWLPHFERTEERITQLLGCIDDIFSADVVTMCEYSAVSGFGDEADDHHTQLAEILGGVRWALHSIDPYAAEVAMVIVPGTNYELLVTGGVDSEPPTDVYTPMLAIDQLPPQVEKMMLKWARADYKIKYAEQLERSRRSRATPINGGQLPPGENHE